MEICKPLSSRPLQRRVTISLTVDRKVLAGLKEWMAKHNRANMSDTVESFIECGIRNSCDGCPYAENEKQQRIGIGKIAPMS